MVAYAARVLIEESGSAVVEVFLKTVELEMYLLHVASNNFEVGHVGVGTPGVSVSGLLLG